MDETKAAGALNEHDGRTEGAKKGQSERRRLSGCFSQAGPCSHLLSSFKGVVMVTAVGTQMWLRG